jgi:menaquinone-dependent protoporphyrinogen oxidase
MPSKILVTYVTRYGSTAEVAKFIAATLRAQGLEVETKPMREVERLDPYGVIVIGAPLYIGHWPREAHHFLTHFRDALVQHLTAIFAVGPIHADPKEFADAHAQLMLEMAKYPWLNPEEVEVFGGVYDPARLSFPDNLLNKVPASPLYKAPASDARDWDAIKAWAEQLLVDLERVGLDAVRQV